ncbi:Na+/H+ antiporter NhaA [Streptomyces sp. K1PA1]|uniref:Na(+)/H(+) antiporter NhaA n=1 Tax=Streptomyces tropicalis TaxID=3034234 RepID=A0ABT6AAV8_9ACTN|nr:Na+/H+ antiporter NhaA [Streptomyces tropicalis]MDF3301785.1 Na+/H+ antiporter NhaA [Streptomyces tropicalis]
MTGRTVCGGGARSPLLAFLRTETGSAAVLLAATVAALVWANASPDTYEAWWHTRLSLAFGPAGVSLDLREWVNSGLMTLFFFVVGLEARREFDIGELRERRRLALSAIAGTSGMLVPVAVFLALNAGQDTARGWGTAMSTDTAFALGFLAVLGSRLPAGLRVFVLGVTVADDFLALAVIALAYSGSVYVPALLAAVGVLAVLLGLRAAGVRVSAVHLLPALALWAALLRSGVDPVVTGLVMGLLTSAHPARRHSLERVSRLFRNFREQPTPELERTLRRGLAASLPPNERLQRMVHPWTGYVIVPLFALANAGLPVSPSRLAHTLASPVTLGILIGYVAGKPIGVAGSTWLAARLSRGRLRPSIGWGAVATGGGLAGAGFTVALLIATLAFDGARLEEAKTGVLAAVVCSFLLSWLITRALALLPPPARARALLGGGETVVDLAEPVDPGRDHVRGPPSAPVTLVEYGDYECPYCGLAEPVVRALLAEFGDDVRYVWRHLPLTDVHPDAQLAAEAAEAAERQGRYWPMHDVLISHQGDLRPPDLLRHAEATGLDTDRFRRDLREGSGAERVAEDVESADLSGVSGTPTFFVNGRRHHGAYDIATLSAAVRAARERAVLAAPRPRR